MKNLTAVVVTVIALTAAARADHAGDFLTDAAKGDNAEIMMGKLALKKAQNPAVKKFGQTLVTDHTKAKKEVAELATTVSVAVPSNVKPEARDMYENLVKMSGADFDRAFVAHMVEDHQKDIAAFTKEASAGDAKVSALATKQLPTLKKHLSIAQSLQGPNVMQGMAPPQRTP